MFELLRNKFNIYGMNKFVSLRNYKIKNWTELDGELDGNWTSIDSVTSTFVDILDLKLEKKIKNFL